MKKFTKISLSVLTIILISLTATTNNANANMFNRFKKGFYFEKYKTADQAKEALLKIHPVGSDVGELIKTLDIATDRKKVFDKSVDDVRERISKKGNYIYFSYIINMSYEWRVIINLDPKDVNKISSLEVYKFFHSL